MKWSEPSPKETQKNLTCSRQQLNDRASPQCVSFQPCTHTPPRHLAGCIATMRFISALHTHTAMVFGRGLATMRFISALHTHIAMVFGRGLAKRRVVAGRSII